jgi:predicted enzyme related to lactoylglutathione lyase
MPGQINWLELSAADTAKACAFYTGLFGWHASEFGGDYHVIDNGPTGAITPRENGFTHLRVYFATSSDPPHARTSCGASGLVARMIAASSLSPAG